MKRGQGTDKQRKLYRVVKKSLEKAIVWHEYDKKLWSEDMFRYIVVRELERYSAVWGKLASDKPNDKKPKIFLERSYRGKNEASKTNHKEIDIVSVYTDKRTLKSEKKKGTRVNELAIELKAKKISWNNWDKRSGDKLGDIKRVRNFVKKSDGNLVFKLGAVVNGNKVTGKKIPKELTDNPRGCKILVGWISDENKPMLKWFKEP